MARQGRGKTADPQGFDMDGREVRKLLTLAMGRGARFAEIFHESGSSNRILMEEDRIKESGGGVRRGVGIRVIHGERTGYAHTDDLSGPQLEEAARAAAHIADGPKGDRPKAVRVGGVFREREGSSTQVNSSRGAASPPCQAWK